jgi:hypothetical protein
MELIDHVLLVVCIRCLEALGREQSGHALLLQIDVVLQRRHRVCSAYKGRCFLRRRQHL